MGAPTSKDANPASAPKDQADKSDAQPSGNADTSNSKGDVKSDGPAKPANSKKEPTSAARDAEPEKSPEVTFMDRVKDPVVMIAILGCVLSVVLIVVICCCCGEGETE